MLGNLIKEDSERFGKYHLLAMDLSTKDIALAPQDTRTSRKAADPAPACSTDQVNSGVAAATDKLVESLQKAAG